MTKNRILTAILTLLLVLTIQAVVLSNVVVRERLLNPEFFIDEMEEHNLYAEIRGQVIYSLMSGAGVQDPTVARIFENSLTEELVKKQVDSLFRDLFAYLNGEREELSLKVSMEEFKDNAENAIRNEISSFIPPQIAGDSEQAELFISRMVGELNKEVPDEIDMAPVMRDGEGGNSFMDAMAGLKRAVGYVNMTFYALMSSILLLIGILAYVLRKPDSILKRIGAAFFLSGTSLYFLNVTVLGMVSQKFGEEEMPPFISKGFLMDVIGDVFGPVSEWGLMLTILGIVMMAAGYIISRKDRVHETEAMRDKTMTHEDLEHERDRQMRMSMHKVRREREPIRRL